MYQNVFKGEGMIRTNLKYFLKYGRFIFGGKETGQVFVVGTGRSGTNFMARVLNAHVEISDLSGGRENSFVFGDVARRAVQDKKLGQFTLKKYRLLSRAASPRIFLDQSHPNLWHIEELINAFPKSKFIGMVRCPYSVAYSTMKHDNVKRWFFDYAGLTSESRFLGLTKDIAENYDRYSIAQKSALRWCAHMYRLDKVTRMHKKSFLVVNYEQLCRRPEPILKAIENFLELDHEFSIPDVNLASLDKKRQLLDKDIDFITRMVDEYFSVNRLEDENFVPLKRYLEFGKGV